MAPFGQPMGAPALNPQLRPGGPVPIPSMVDQTPMHGPLVPGHVNFGGMSLAHLLAAAAAAAPHLQHRMGRPGAEQPVNMGDGPVSYRPQQHYPQYRGLGRAAAGY